MLVTGYIVNMTITRDENGFPIKKFVGMCYSCSNSWWCFICWKE